MKHRVSTYEAKTHLSRLLQAVSQGEEVVICRSDVPIARIISFSAADSATKKKRARVGSATSGRVRYAADAFSPLESEADLEEWGLNSTINTSLGD